MATQGQSRPGRRRTRRLTFWAAFTAVLLLSGAGIFTAGWVVAGWNSAQLPVITTEGDIGYTTLISPGDDDFTVINGLTGEKVEFLPRSDMNILDPAGRYLFTTHEAGADSGLTRIDLQTGATDVLLSPGGHDFNNLDGLAWTPWDTLLMGEETTGGRVFEVMSPTADPDDVRLIERTAFGTRRHEGLAVDRYGNVYGVDEVKGGGIYRFRPDSPLATDSLSSGTLEALVADESISRLKDGRVTARWRPADEHDPTGFNRPEDIEIARDTLYVALTGSSEIISIDISDPSSPSIGLFASRGVNAPGLTEPDNLASTPQGDIYAVENIGSSLFTGKKNEMWLMKAAEDPLAPAERVELVATLNSPRDEFSGVLVDPARGWVFVNVLGPDNFILVLRP
jgi:hypothetical protein